MKRLLILYIVFQTVCLGAMAQFVVNSTTEYLNIEDNAKYNLDHLILVNGMDMSTSLQYTGSNDVKWVHYDGGTEYPSTGVTMYVEDGMLLSIQEFQGGVAMGDKEYVYVIDYSLYNATLNSLVVDQGDKPCEGIYLELSANVPALLYKDRGGVARTLDRQYKVIYDNLKWNKDEWIDVLDTVYFPQVGNRVYIKAPLKNEVEFCLYGDQWAEDMMIALDSVCSDFYYSVAVEAYPKGEVEERVALNEKDRSSEQSIQGSGPLVVDFYSRANPVNGVFYEWTFWDVQTPDAYTRYTDADFRHTFTETGEYQVRLVVTSPSGCVVVDSLNVKVIESYIEAPNAFSPNGDGINDEFRVAYKSIATYKCVIKNRWGRTVYEGTDPGKGWDGKISGREAAVGTYYFVILATGMDRDMDGDIMEYKLSGALNLIR